jgi:hypothetical protein
MIRAASAFAFAIGISLLVIGVATGAPPESTAFEIGGLLTTLGIMTSMVPGSD